MCAFALLLSHVWLLETLWTIACQAPQSMGFSRQEYWSGLPFPSPGDLTDPGIKPRSHALQADALTSEPSGKPSVVTHEQEETQNPEILPEEWKVQTLHWVPQLLKHALERWQPSKTVNFENQQGLCPESHKIVAIQKMPLKGWNDWTHPPRASTQRQQIRLKLERD